MPVGKICPKCNYQRKPDDDAFFPDYECPKCGVVYAHAEAPPKKAAPVPEQEVRETVKIIAPEPKSTFSLFLKNHSAWIITAAIVIALSTGGYVLFFAPHDLYYQAQDGHIQPAGRTLEAFISNLKKAYEFKSYEALVDGGGKLVAGSNRPFGPFEIVSPASPGRFTIWLKKGGGFNERVVHKVLFAPAPAKSVIGEYRSIPEHPIDNAIVKKLYPPFLVKLWDEFPTLQQKRLHVRLLDTSRIEIAQGEPQNEKPPKPARDPHDKPAPVKALKKRQLDAKKQALSRMKLTGAQSE